MSTTRRGSGSTFSRETADASGVLARYGELLPIGPGTPHLSLGEGSTPLLDAPRLANWLGLEHVHIKFEGTNPTGSFKDRGMVVAVAKALEAGARAVLCASTGNTAASAAAYAARAGIEAVALLPGGKVALGKVAQAVMYGARVVVLDVNFDRALDVAREAADRYPLALVNSVNPHRIAGQASAAWEICDVLHDAPQVLALPVGNGGNITAYWSGFRRYAELARIARLPRMLGVQAAGAAPLVQGHAIENPETIATAIRIGRPATWEPAIAAARDSGGLLIDVTDDAILEAYHRVAELEGTFCEPASAASIAGLRRAVKEGIVTRQERCVCVLTGNGLKDPDTALAAGVTASHLPANAEALAAHLGIH
jgi:threonine synthase